MPDNLRHAQYGDGGMQIDDPQAIRPPLSSPSIKAIPRRTMARGRTLIGVNSATAGTAAGATWHLTAASDAPFTHIAPIFMSVETGTITITSCAVAAVAGTGGSGMPTGFPHSSAAYLPATFGGSTSGTIPVRVAAGVPSVYVGDLIPCRSLVPSADGLYWLAIRAFFAGSGYSYRAIASVTGIAGSGDQLVGHGWSQCNQIVDGVSVPANFTNASAGTNQVIAGFITLNDNSGQTLISFGDSTVGGVGSPSGVISGEGLAVYNLSARSYRYAHINAGLAGATPSVYGAFARATLQSLARYITYAIYRVSSINQPCNSQTRCDDHWAEAMRFVEQCQISGIVAILETCTPQNLGSVANDIYRKQLNDRVRAGTDWVVIDIDRIVADSVNTWQYKAEYNSGDNSHPNLAGYQAMDEFAIRPVLASLLESV